MLKKNCLDFENNVSSKFQISNFQNSEGYNQIPTHKKTESAT